MKEKGDNTKVTSDTYWRGIPVMHYLVGIFSMLYMHVFSLSVGVLPHPSPRILSQMLTSEYPPNTYSDGSHIGCDRHP